MNLSIYDCKNHREYLQKALPVAGEGRGLRTKLALALNVQNGFVSLALAGKADFSLEHAVKISRFLDHDESESDFFLLQVHRDRADSNELKNYYDKKLKAILAERSKIVERVATTAPLPETARALYYSSWHYTAIHMCLRVNGLQTKKEISDRLRLPQKKVAEVLGFMVEQGLAVQESGRYVAGPTRIHLAEGSPMLSRHHSNWRIRAVQSLDASEAHDLHYSLVMSLSEEAAEKIRALLLDSVERAEPILKEAKDETVYALNIDLFSLIAK